MLTQCPHCLAAFRLQAQQLVAARGFVVCGACEQVFLALDRLADEVAAPPMPLMAGARPAPEPPAVRHYPDEEARTYPRAGAAAQADTADDIPAVLRADLARLQQPRVARGGAAWMAFAVLLLLVFALQIGWTWRAQWLAHYPPASPWLALLCARVGCQAEPPAPLSKVVMLAREVRDHPQYQDTLLVNATLVNREDHPVAYPMLQLRLFDPVGTALGVRQFAPAEYLDQSIHLAGGMPSNVPIYVVLEIASRNIPADNFEFTFF
ncbi:MAG: DUF3426 domain-containing protein [Gammaproteobacteria bacterium]|nr:DUF3426 domain-containing protein [Gammaproteobacteria bacterium]